MPVDAVWSTIPDIDSESESHDIPLQQVFGAVWSAI